MSENIFYTKFSELSGNRIDPFYYIPELVELEKQVRKVSKKRLRDFVLSVSSGATPKKSVSNEYYTEDEKDGIPFLRVQNLTQYGKLDFKGLKFITQATHEGMLKRSQVEEDDLLVKITGVGRMAIASVPEKGFTGNTNQHMVVIKTKDRKTSETLATYLNLDIAEKLASRRATGGTRPALDYPALLSIPVVYDENIVSKLNDAYKQKEKKEKEAQNKLGSIDTYLLNELGIKSFSDENENLEDRVFFRKFSELSGDRWDSEFYQPKHIINETNLFSSKYEISNIKNIVTFIASGSTPKSGGNDYEENGNIYFLRLTNFNDNLEVDLTKSLYIKSNIHNKMLKRSQLQNGDILFGIAGSIGKIAIFDKNIEANINQAIATLRFKENINKLYIAYLLNSSIVKQQTARLQRPVAQPNLNTEELKSLKIPLPPIEIQNKIANHVQNLRNEAQALKDKATQTFEDAKKEVENMILGKVHD